MNYVIDGESHSLIMLYAKIESGEISPEKATQAMNQARKNRPWHEKLLDFIDGGEC